MEEITLIIKYKNQTWFRYIEYDSSYGDPIDDFIDDEIIDWRLENKDVLQDFQEHKDTYSINYYLTENV